MKHYDIAYLENTQRLLKDLKQHSYNYFTSVGNGTIVDLGCGAGDDVIQLSKLLGGAIKVIGVDHDLKMLEQAKSNSEGLASVDFILSEASPLPFESESISGLRTERMIQHLFNPQEVMQEISRVLKVGSPLVVIETDWHSLSFYTEFVEVERKINTYLTDVKVNNGYAARKLTSYLKKSNFQNINFQIHPFVINTLEEANEYFWLEKIIKEAADKGYITNEECMSFYDELQNANDKSYFSCSINLVSATCLK